jgi:adenosylhomocysteine nucleosidase
MACKTTLSPNCAIIIIWIFNNGKWYEIWFLVAIQEEFYYLNANICYTGIGKIAATIAAQYVIDMHRPKMIVNVGTAGSSVFDYGEIVNCYQFVQRDMNLTEFMAPKFVVPYSNNSQVLKYGYNDNRYKSAICGTGDTFVRNIETDIWNCVDMESFAIAYVCHEIEIPFRCYKFISDGKSANTTDKQWESVLAEAKSSLNKLAKNDLIPRV